MKTDGSGALHSEKQTEDEGGEGAQAATLCSPVGEDGVNDTVNYRNGGSRSDWGLPGGRLS